MILQKLVRYYERQRRLPGSDIAPPGWIRRALDYVIVLRESGECVDLQQLFTLKKGKPIGAQELLPTIGKQARKHNNSHKDANLLWDNAGFALGIGQHGSVKLQSFVETLDKWFPDATDPGVLAVRHFTSALRANPAKAVALIERFSSRDQFEKRDPVVAFRLLSDGPIKVHERPAVRAAYEARCRQAGARAVIGRCLVSGDENVPLASHETVIKGVWNAQPSGANLVSFNKDSFISYGKRGRQGECAPVGRDASSAYSTALNFLLESSRNRVQVGDASTVFWADGESRFDGEFTLADFFGEDKDDPDRGVRAVQALFASLKTGQMPDREGRVEFCVLGLAAPSKARLTVRFWIREPLATIAPRIAQHFRDLEIQPRFDNEPKVPPMCCLLASLSLDSKVKHREVKHREVKHREVKHLPPRFAGEWIHAVLSGLPYPRHVLGAAIQRARAEQAKQDNRGKRTDNVPYFRAAAIKGWLNRWSRTHERNRKEITVALDRENTDVSYRLGRLFAAYEKIQADAAGRELNRTIRDSYFGAAMATPATIFARLARLNQHHMGDLRRSNPGLHNVRDRLLGEIADALDGRLAFPATLPLAEQGRFTIGYYHQRQAFYTRKDAAGTNLTEK
jgi:CRISPR-associated protein Csd1